MKITVTRSGGFAGLTRVWSVEVSNHSESEQWKALIDRLPWGQNDKTSEEPDRYSYLVRCDQNEARISERALTGPWRELLDRVRQIGEENQVGEENQAGKKNG